MPDEINHPDGRLEHPSVRREPTDAQFSLILGIVVTAVVLLLLIFGMVHRFFFHERDRLNQERMSRFPLAPEPSRALPPEPRLEQLDRLAEVTISDVGVRLQAKEAALNSYGPTQEKGFIHIPIDRAIQLLAGRLPARNEARVATGIGSAGTVGLLAAPCGPGVLAAAAALFPGRDAAIQDALSWGANGLVDGGESNAGRMFNRRKPPWLEP